MRFGLDTTSTLDRQVGVISRRQLRSHGYAGAQIDAMLRRGHLERVDHGIYRRTGSGRVSHQEEVVALLRCGPAARLTGARLLGHLGVQGFSLDDPFTVLVRPGRRFGAARFSVRTDPAVDLHRATYGPANVPRDDAGSHARRARRG